MIKSNLKPLMDEQGIKIYKLAEELKVSRTAIRDLYHGMTTGLISLNTLDKLCKRFNKNVGEMLERLPDEGQVS